MSARVIEIPPRFRLVSGAVPALDVAPHVIPITLMESSAFGDGTHETTRMCLQALAAFAPSPPFRMFDVGSGSGVLAIAAAKLGGEAVGVEIDDSANEVARANANANAVGAQVSFGTTWPEGTFHIVVANILRQVLLDLAESIVARVARPGRLVLSGLVSTDVPAICARYVPLASGLRPEIFERDVWRTLVWRL